MSDRNLPMSLSPALPALSARLPARYRLGHPVGSGSMATVFHAWDCELAEPCAIKLLRPGHPQAKELERRFSEEARIVAQLHHPNIVQLRDYGVSAHGTAYLVMELLEGQDLQHLLAEGRQVPIQQALAIAMQIGRALHAIHQIGVVHRDIKPQNIFLCKTAHPELAAVKVIDFGLAKQPRDSGSGHSDGLVIGTLEYLAPEATLGISALVDARADQWALAVVVYRMLSGSMPLSLGAEPLEALVRIRSLRARPLRELRPEIPPHIEQAIDRALAKDKEQRFADIEEFICALGGSSVPSSLTLNASTPLAPEDEPEGTRRLPALAAIRLAGTGEVSAIAEVAAARQQSGSRISVHTTPRRFTLTAASLKFELALLSLLLMGALLHGMFGSQWVAAAAVEPARPRCISRAHMLRPAIVVKTAATVTARKRRSVENEERRWPTLKHPGDRRRGSAKPQLPSCGKPSGF